MPDIRTTEFNAATRVWDGPAGRHWSDDYVGTVGPGWGDDGWIVTVWRKLRSREDALKVLALVAELTHPTEEDTR